MLHSTLGTKSMEKRTFTQMSSSGSFETKYSPVDVSFVAFVCTVFPCFNAPFSTTPPPGTGFLARAFAPFKTVKFALDDILSASLSRTCVWVKHGWNVLSTRLESLVAYKLISSGFRLTIVGIPK